MSVSNRINYIEFQAPDLEGIKKFYTKAFGWSFTDFGPTYVAFNDGGFEKGEAVVQGGALVILFSDDLEGTLANVELCGGTITKPVFEFPGGKRFHFLDPAGNELAVWGHV